MKRFPLVKLLISECNIVLMEEGTEQSGCKIFVSFNSELACHLAKCDAEYLEKKKGKEERKKFKEMGDKSRQAKVTENIHLPPPSRRRCRCNRVAAIYDDTLFIVLFQVNGENRSYLSRIDRVKCHSQS